MCIYLHKSCCYCVGRRREEVELTHASYYCTGVRKDIHPRKWSRGGVERGEGRDDPTSLERHLQTPSGE